MPTNLESGKLLVGGQYVLLQEQPLGKGSYGSVYSGYLFHETNSRRVKFAMTSTVECSSTLSIGAVKSGNGLMSAAASLRETSICEEPTEVAIKVILKTHVQKLKGLETVDRELSILQELAGHPSILRVYDAFEYADNTVFVVMEKIHGGHLLNRIICRQGYTEEDAREISRNLMQALAFIHERNIAHRDIKHENILMTGLEDDTQMKIADFGFAVRTDEDGGGLTRTCGTPEYIAPEILKAKRDKSSYGLECDVWSMGVVIFIILAGYLPFGGETKNDVLQKVSRGHYFLDESVWSRVSNDALDFVKKLLVVNPKERLSAHEALQHRWLRSKESYSLNDLRASFASLRKSVAKTEAEI